MRVGMAMGGTHPGVHDIGAWGAVGAAAGVAHALSVDEDAEERSEACRRAIELGSASVLATDAATVFSGSTGQLALFGSSVQLGLATGRSAVAGLRAPEGTLERHLVARAGKQPDLAPLCAGLAGGSFARHEVTEGYIKLHPSCALLHGAVVAAREAGAGRAQAPHRPAPLHVEVATYREAAAFDDPAPPDLAAARFSLPVVVAGELLGVEGIRLDGAVLEVARAVTVRHDPELDLGYPAGRPAVVEVRWSDGSVTTGRAGRVPGDGYRSEESAAIAAKAHRLTEGRFGPGAGERLAAAVQALADGSATAELGAVLRALAARPGPSRPSRLTSREPVRRRGSK